MRWKLARAGWDRKVRVSGLALPVFRDSLRRFHERRTNRRLVTQVGNPPGRAVGQASERNRSCPSTWTHLRRFPKRRCRSTTYDTSLCEIVNRKVPKDVRINGVRCLPYTTCLAAAGLLPRLDLRSSSACRSGDTRAGA